MLLPDEQLVVRYLRVAVRGRLYIKAQTLEFSSQSDDAGEDQASVTLTVV